MRIVVRDVHYRSEPLSYEHANMKKGQEPLPAPALLRSSELVEPRAACETSDGPLSAIAALGEQFVGKRRGVISHGGARVVKNGDSFASRLYSAAHQLLNPQSRRSARVQCELDVDRHSEPCSSPRQIWIRRASPRPAC